MSDLTINRIAGALGAEVTGLSLTRELTAGELGALRAAVPARKDRECRQHVPTCDEAGLRR